MTLMDARCGQGHRSVWRLELVPVLKTGPLSRRHRTGEYFLPTLVLRSIKERVIAFCEPGSRRQDPTAAVAAMAGCRRIHGRPAHPGIPLEQARRGYSTGTAVSKPSSRPTVVPPLRSLSESPRRV